MIPSTHRFVGPTLVGCAALLIIGLAFPQASGAAIYKWKDDNGKLHFTDQPSKIPLKYRKEHGKPVYKTLPSETQDSPAGSASIEGEGSDKFYAFNNLGQRMPIIVRDNTVLFALATWCPYSKKLVRFLNNPSIAREMKHLELIFIFEDEWPHIKQGIDESVGKGGLTQKQADEQLQYYKKKAEGKIVYNPAFIKNLPGKHYFATSGATKLQKIFPKKIPRVYSSSQKDFDQGVKKWLGIQFDDRKGTRDYLRDEYGKYTEN